MIGVEDNQYHDEMMIMIMEGDHVDRLGRLRQARKVQIYLHFGFLPQYPRPNLKKKIVSLLLYLSYRIGVFFLASISCVKNTIYLKPNVELYRTCSIKEMAGHAGQKVNSKALALEVYSICRLQLCWGRFA